MSDLKIYFKLTQKIKELQKKRDDLKNKIMQDVDNCQTEGNYKAKICERSFGFDQKRFKEERPRLYKKYYVSDKYKYLLVTQVNKSKAA